MTAVPVGLCECGCGQTTNLHTLTAHSRGFVKGAPRRFILGHQRKEPTPVEDRFWSKVIESPTGCWIWTGAHIRGYGQVSRKGHPQRTLLAHRWAYEYIVGKIPDGLQLDHLCVTPACVNPAHLEPVTQQENLRRAAERKTHCRNGHLRSPENTIGRKKLRCRACAIDGRRARAAALLDAA